jgi:hypothetical protein
MFFMDDVSPVYLNTDASNVGIGAYLHQLVEGKRIPIQFVSKLLTKPERRWDTVEKEAYAIVYSSKKLEYLLRDRQFILRTDSKNLTYLNTEHKPKVQRWKLSVQHMDFKVQHIAGKDNIEADAFSRWKKEERNELNVMNLEKINDRDYLPKEVYERIKKAHNMLVGHDGVQRTIESLLKTGIPKWKGMRKDVNKFIKECVICQKMSTQNIGSKINPFTLSCVEPMQRIYIDTIGHINLGIIQ